MKRTRSWPVSLPEGAPAAPRHLEKFIPAVRRTTETVERHAARAMTPRASALGRARTPPAWGAMARAFAMTLFGYTMRHLAWPARKTGGAALELKAVETPGKSPCGFLPEADPYCSPSSGGELRIRREQTAKQLTYSNRRFYK